MEEKHCHIERENRDVVDAFFRFHKLKISSMLPIPHSDGVILMNIEHAMLSKGKKGVTVTELAKNTKVKVSSVSRSLNHLTKDGYVERYMDERDRRNTYLRVTAKGEAVLKEMDAIMQDFFGAVRARVGAERIDEMVAFLTDFYKVMEEEIANHPYSKEKIRSDNTVQSTDKE